MPGGAPATVPVPQGESGPVRGMPCAAPLAPAPEERLPAAAAPPGPVAPASRGYAVEALSSGRLEAGTVPGLWLHAEWLWQDPLPPVARCLEAVLGSAESRS